MVRNTPHLVDWRSLSLITALIMTSKGLELSGIFSRLAPGIVERAGGSEKRLMLYILPIIALSSAVIMNDTAMLVFIPLVVATAEVAGINVARAVTLSAIAANVGSALTPIGNPQNVVIWRRYGVSFWAFIVHMLPFFIAWVSLLLLFAMSIKERTIKVRTIPPVAVNLRLLVTSVLLLVMNVLLAETGFHWLALPVTVLVLLTVGREALWGFDWALLLTFAFIFVDFNELALLMGHARLQFPSSGVRLMLTSAGVSQVISNVPATVLLTSNSRPDWLPLTVGVNIGGTGLIIGSIANLIAVRIARIRLRDFHRYSIPYFLAALVMSALILLLFQ
ncbi:MAG: anion transporter [Thermococci archaeon]|nr:anion transporter [Thermococci archaeon]